MVQSTGYIFVVSLVALISIKENELAIIKVPYDPKDEVANEKFSQLLTSIADLNRQKMYGLKKYAALANSNIGSGFPKHIHKEDPIIAVIVSNDSMLQAPDNLFDKTYDNAPSKPPMKTPRQMKKENYSYNDIEKAVTNELFKIFHTAIENSKKNEKSIVNVKIRESDEDKIDDYMKKRTERVKRKSALRLWEKISKAAIKQCKKACKAAYKDVCHEYMCSGHMKNSFKKSCKSSCKDKLSDDKDEEDTD